MGTKKPHPTVDHGGPTTGGVTPANTGLDPTTGLPWGQTRGDEKAQAFPGTKDKRTSQQVSDSIKAANKKAKPAAKKVAAKKAPAKKVGAKKR